MNLTLRHIIAFLTVAFTVITQPLYAAEIPYYKDSTVATMATASARSWGGLDNTGSSTLMEVIFDYTAALDTLTHSVAASSAPTTPVVIWEAGGTGDGTALVLDGDNLVFFAGDGSGDYVSAAHGLSAGQNDVRVMTHIDWTTKTLETYVNGTSIGSGGITTSSGTWAGTNNSAIGQIGINAIFEDGAAAPFLESDAVNFNDGGSNIITFSVYDASAAGFSPDNVSATVFRTDFEYRTEPTLNTGNASTLDGAMGQIGSFSGSLPINVGSTGKIGFDNNNRDGGGTRLLTNDRPADGPGSFFANLGQEFSLNGATVSFDAATRRTQGDNTKDYNIIGYDQSGNEAFHIVIDTNNGGTYHERVGVLYHNGSTPDNRQENLIATFGGTGADANEDFTNTGDVPTAAQLAHVELNLTDTGYTITFDRDSGARAYTTDIIPYNSTSVSGLYRVEFTYADGGSDATRSGYYLDNITVVIPEPATIALLAVGGIGLIARRRKR